MKVFAFKIGIPEQYAAEFARKLMDHARTMRITLSSSSRDSDDPEDTVEREAHSFTCEAPQSLKPEQIIALMELCRNYEVTVFSIHYIDMNEEENGEVHHLPASKPPHVHLVVDNTVKKP